MPRTSYGPYRVVFLLAVLLFSIIATGQIVLTYSVFCQTFDEPLHIAAGMEWLDRGKYTFEYLHPPLARVAVALGPFLDGLRLAGHANMLEEGNQILYARGQYSHNLALARLGVLPFFLLVVAIVCAWSWMLFGDTASLFAVVLFTSLPPVLAHAGLATTDMPLTATLTGALFTFVLWLECPTISRSLVLGLATAGAILSKFSALLFLPSCGLAILACRWLVARPLTKPQAVPGSRRLTAIAVTALVVFLLIWGGYRFSVSTLVAGEDRPHEVIDLLVGKHGTLHDLAYWMAKSIPIPAPELFLGIDAARKRNSTGNFSFLLGKIHESGSWYFFPVALAVKTPLPFLILVGLGMAFLGRKALPQGAWLALGPAVNAITLLLVCLPVSINVGVRHILPIYPLLAIVAGFGAASLWNVSRHRQLGRVAILALLFWQLLSCYRTHPDYLAYFNELAGRHPDQILVDSDLDWGQDLLRLADVLRKRGISAVSIAYFGTADLTRHNLPRLRPLLPYQPTTGWIAISETPLKKVRGSPYAWLEAYKPVTLVGRSIRLYYVREGVTCRSLRDCSEGTIKQIRFLTVR